MRVLHAHGVSPIEGDAMAFRNAVVKMASDRNTPVDVVVIALADVIALAAATQDLTEGSPQRLDGRIDAFLARMEQTYDRALQDMRPQIKA